MRAGRVLNPGDNGEERRSASFLPTTLRRVIVLYLEEGLNGVQIGDTIKHRVEFRKILGP